MSTRSIDLVDGFVLKDDIYKDNTLLLKRGSVLNAYLLNKLNNFGVWQYREAKTSEFKEALLGEKEILILETNELQARKTKDILKFAGFSDDSIVTISSSEELEQSLADLKLKYVFVDSSFYDKELIEKIFLASKNKNIKIFVTNATETTNKNVKYNTEYQNVKFLHRPLANSYIKALLRLYS